MPKSLTPNPDASGQKAYSKAGLADLAERVVAWQAQHGRQGLPWQNTQDPYRVWLSEIMLQQTQVSTVLTYYPRFLQRFPDVRALALAHEDEVLGLWSGLGYYSRARNLHRCAQVVVQQHEGQFPRTAMGLQALPGIGPSTAAAVAAFCFGERVAIFDGNVRRVLARVLGCADDLSVARHAQSLWSQATDLLPRSELPQTMPRYTQGMMDLGATVCLARQPRCEDCPLALICRAQQQGTPLAYPVKTRKLKRSAQALWLLWLQDSEGRSCLYKRPPRGIWASLYSLPVFESHAAVLGALPPSWREAMQTLPVFTHVLTHKDLHLHPMQVQIGEALGMPLKGTDFQSADWYAPSAWAVLGLPAPVRSLLLGKEGA
jgi:A/G-specific adenine glycosylase